MVVTENEHIFETSHRFLFLTATIANLTKYITQQHVLLSNDIQILYVEFY